MRLLVELEAAKNQIWERNYHHKLQGFVYSFFEDAMPKIHEKKGYKFFCFSNIFPIQDMNEGDRRKLLISSPSQTVTDIVKGGLESRRKEGKPANIGEMQFHVKGVREVRRPFTGGRVIAATPIVLRIPEYNYDLYGIPPAERKKRYVYWRPNIAFEAFIKQLNENIFKKCREFYSADGREIEEFPLFESFVFKKSVVNHVVLDGIERKFVGSVWEFQWSHVTKEQREVLEFAMDTGFGERNPLGFGFVNVMG